MKFDMHDAEEKARSYLLSVFGSDLGLRSQALAAAETSVDQFIEIYEEGAELALATIYNHIASVVWSFHNEGVPEEYHEVGQALLTQAAVMLTQFKSREDT